MPNNSVIHGRPEFINFEMYFNRLEVYLAFLPLIYTIPSVFVIFRIFSVFWKSLNRNYDSNVNIHIFLVISLSQCTCLILFVSDFIVNRIAATGAFTSWCARSPPNNYLLLIFVISQYSTYSLRAFPFVLSILRLTFIIYPTSHHRVSTFFLKIAIPFIFLYPIPLTSFLITAVGVCKQLDRPFSFGAITIYYAEPVFGLRNSFFMIPTATFWLFACIFVDFLLFIKLYKVKSRNSTITKKSNRGYKAELSLTLTIIVMVFSHLTNLVFVYSNVFFPQYTDYTFMIRPFGNDCQLVVVSWIFYLSHPVFKKRTMGSSPSISVRNMDLPFKSDGNTRAVGNRFRGSVSQVLTVE